MHFSYWSYVLAFPLEYKLQMGREICLCFTHHFVPRAWSISACSRCWIQGFICNKKTCYNVYFFTRSRFCCNLGENNGIHLSICLSQSQLYPYTYSLVCPFAFKKYIFLKRYLFFWHGSFLESFLNLLQCYFCFVFWYFGHEAYGTSSLGTRNWTCTPCIGRMDSQPPEPKPNL